VISAIGPYERLGFQVRRCFLDNVNQILLWTSSLILQLRLLVESVENLYFLTTYVVCSFAFYDVFILGGARKLLMDRHASFLQKPAYANSVALIPLCLHELSLVFDNQVLLFFAWFNVVLGYNRNVSLDVLVILRCIV
jgi:hypothetical protein